MRQISNGGIYLNFAGFLEEGEKLLHEAHGENYERLVALKTKYDPTNLFRLNHNLKPTVPEACSLKPQTDGSERSCSGTERL